MYGKYGYDINSSAEYVLHHISIGRPLNYHSIPRHLYWKQPFSEPPATPAGIFVRADNGWAQGLHPMDRFVKNTYEILSPLNAITSRMRMTQHAFLTADRKVRKSIFGEGSSAVTVTVNGSDKDSAVAFRGADLMLPPNGFIVDSPSFVAFCAMQFDGLSYQTPTCFTIHSLDGQPLEDSKKVRIFHAFGDPRIRFRGVEQKVDKEIVMAP